MNIFSFLEDSARRDPSKAAIVDDHGEVSYHTLLCDALALRDQLQKAGMGPGHAVAISFSNGAGFIVSLFAAAGTGAVVIPLSPTMRPFEIDKYRSEVPFAFYLRETSSRELVDAGSLCSVTAGTTAVLQRYSENLSHPFASHIEDPVFMRFTSGTTGHAKGVLFSHKSVADRLSAVQRSLQISEEDSVLWVMPMAFHFIASITLYIRFGATIVVCRELLAESMFEKIRAYRCSLLYCSPIHYQLLAAAPHREPFESLRLAISTASSCPKRIMDNFAARFDLPVTQVFGIIEVGLPLGNFDMARTNPELLGKVLPGYEAKIIDSTGVEVADNTVGSLLLRGEGLFDGYYYPSLTREQVLNNGWFETGDLALRDEQGNFHLKGREKSVINVSGNKVFPEEVEEVLLLHPEVIECRVYGATHPSLGETVNAEIVWRTPHQPKEQELMRFCYEKLSSYKVPKELRAVSSIAKTPTGKVSRFSVAR